MRKQTLGEQVRQILRDKCSEKSIESLIEQQRMLNENGGLGIALASAEKPQRYILHIPTNTMLKVI
jgi:hypothetical protein